jgi:hypothetical protein
MKNKNETQSKNLREEYKPFIDSLKDSPGVEDIAQTMNYGIVNIKQLQQALNINIKEVKRIYEITTPFLDIHNDHIQIYLELEHNSNPWAILTDKGITLSDLKASGYDWTTEENHKSLIPIVKNFKINLSSNGELSVETNYKYICDTFNRLIQAIITIITSFTIRKTLEILSEYQTEMNEREENSQKQDEK